MKQQQGAVLVISMIGLMALSLFLVLSLQQLGLDFRVSNHQQQRLAVRQAAEFALQNGENWLAQQNTPPLPISTCPAPCQSTANVVFAAASTGANPNFDPTTFSWATAVSPMQAPVPTENGYVIEGLGAEPDVSLVRGIRYVPTTQRYRISALGTFLEGREPMRFLVQSLYTKEY